MHAINTLPQIKLIADMTAVKSRLEKDKEILEVYSSIEGILKLRISELDKKSLPLGCTPLQYWELRKDHLLTEESLKSKQAAIENLQNRADEWEVAFEQNTLIVNENFQTAMDAAHKKSGHVDGDSVIINLVLGYEENKDAVLSSQQAKNNLYYQLVEQLNTKKR